MKSNFYLLLAFLLTMFFVFYLAPTVSAENTYQQNYSITGAGQVVSPNLVVQALKYEPYPVTPGSSFDLWVQVQNLGQSDAQNVRFQIVDGYPFSSNASSRTYGVIPGTINGYNLMTSSDAVIEANQVVMKFQVNVAPDSPEGITNLQIKAFTSNSSNPIAYNIPIDIEKTRSTFNIKVSQITPQQSSFIITNIGNNNASSIVVDVPSQKGVSILQGYQPSTLGNLNPGNFALAHLDMVPFNNTKNITLEISYTDTAGLRNTINETVPLISSQLQNVCVQQPGNPPYWAYVIVGVLIGAFIVIMIMLILKKRKSPTH